LTTVAGDVAVAVADWIFLGSFPRSPFFRGVRDAPKLLSIEPSESESPGVGLYSSVELSSTWGISCSSCSSSADVRVRTPASIRASAAELRRFCVYTCTYAYAYVYACVLADIRSCVNVKQSCWLTYVPHHIKRCVGSWFQ
jgi:hypothetical protein